MIVSHICTSVSRGGGLGGGRPYLNSTTEPHRDHPPLTGHAHPTGSPTARTYRRGLSDVGPA